MPSGSIQLSSELEVNFFYGFELDFYGVSGVNVYPWPACAKCNRPTLIFGMSNVDFYVNGKPSSEYTCNPDIIPDDSSLGVSYFSSYVYDIKIEYGNTYGSFSSPAICPYLFKNAVLYDISLNFQVESFLFVSLFRFQQVNYTEKSSINSNVSYELAVEGYNYKLDTGILHPLVFEKTPELYCSGTIQSVQTDLFKNFQLLTSLSFYLTSLGNFYHQIGIKWLKYLNKGSVVTLNSQYIPYVYPDSDFCIFAEFPLDKSIALELDIPKENTSTLFVWLCKSGGMIGNPCNQSINSSKINASLNLCNLKEKQINSYPTYPDYYQTQVINMFFMQLIPFVLIPCACLIGLFLNWIIIKTVKENEKKDLKEDFYKYMRANAKFNCIYCLTFVFYPMTSCDWRLSYSFCSSIFTSQIVQYVFIAYFGETIKMCANFSYLMMTLNRYLLVGKDHSQWLVGLAKIEFKWLIRGSILFSALINIGHGWQFQAVEDLKFKFQKSYTGNYYQLNGYSFSDYPFANQSQAYLIYAIVYFVINFGVFFALNTGIEIKLVRRMHKELTEKRERLTKMNADRQRAPVVSTASVDLSKASQSVEANEREEEDFKKERKVIKMVMFNCFFNFVLRAPDILFWMESQSVWSMFYTQYLGIFGTGEEDSQREYTPGLLSLISDVGFLTYILTFSTNFLIFYKFNKNFKEASVFFWKTSKS
jgi:hypothetical protein